MKQWSKTNKAGKAVMVEVMEMFKEDEDGSKKAMLPGIVLLACSYFKEKRSTFLNIAGFLNIVCDIYKQLYI